MPTPSDYYDPGTGNWRNFNPPPTTPGVFNPADPYGRRPDPSRTTESSTRDGNPQATQTAAAPPPTPGAPTPLTPPVPPPAPPNENIDQPTPPTPDKAAPPPEPAAKPLPNLGAWTPEQAKPWMHVKQIAPQQVPDRPPDTHVGTRPAWHPRPGEAGYGHGPRQPGNYSFGEMLGLALQAGFTGPAAYTAAAIGLAESNGNPNSIHYQDGGKPFNSYGLMQINGSNDAAVGGARNALDPLTSFKQAYTLSKGGADFSPWSTFNDGSYKAYLDGNARPEASSTLVAGPRQEYMPPQGREPQHWGSTPEHDWTPGNMPTAHDIPGIMGGMLPLVLTLFAGAAMGGGLGMVAAFSGYQNARNKGQLEAAKEAKTQYQDHLKETTAKLKEELLGAQGILADFGTDQSSPEAQTAWRSLAANFDDRQLNAALESGDMGKVADLFKRRDAVFQNLSKTSDAQSRADHEQEEKDQLARDVNAGLGVQTPGAAPGTQPAAAAPQPGLNWNMGGGATPSPAAPVPTEPPSGPAGVPQASADGRAAPAAPTPTPSVPPPEATPPATEAAPPAGGEPAATLPDVAVSAPANDPLARLTPQEQAIARDVLAGGEMPKFPAQAAASETRIEAAVAGLNQQLRRVGDNPNLRDERAIVGAVRQVDPLTADNLSAIAHNQLPLPGSETGTSGSGGSRGVMGYRNLMSTLARKVNPNWDPGQWAGIEKFRDPSGLTQRSIGRITAIGDAGTKLQEDLKHIPDNPTQFQRQLDQFIKQGFTDDPAYSNLFTDWQTFIIDSNALTQGGQGLEGETEQMIKSIPMYGQKSAYVGALKRHASFALSRYQQYQNQWGQLQRTDPMFGHNDVAEKQLHGLADIKEGQPGGMPQVGPGGEGYENVPKGGQYIGPDGKTYTKG